MTRKIGPGRIQRHGKPTSSYNPRIVPGYYITYSEYDRLVRENGYDTKKVKALMKDKNFFNSYRVPNAA